MLKRLSKEHWIPQKKRAFNKLNKYRLFSQQMLVSITLLCVMTSLYADVSVNNIENNDKVAADSLPAGTELISQPSDTQSKVWELRAEQWEFARSGESVLSLPVLNNVVNNWLTDKQKLIEIQYPGGEEGEFWVQELTDWLVSLGIPSNHMIIVPGSGSGDMIKFDLIKQ
jgi:hypothetical protein